MRYNVKIIVGQTELLEEQLVEYEDYTTVKDPSVTDVSLINNACAGTMEIGATASDCLKFRVLNPNQTIFDGEAVELWVIEADESQRPMADTIEEEVGDATADEVEYSDGEEEVADPDEPGEDLGPEEEADVEAVDAEMELGLTEQLEGTEPDPETDVDPDPGAPTWERIGTYYVYKQDNNNDGSITLTCYDGFMLMSGQFQPDSKTATVTAMYNDLRAKVLTNCGITVDTEDFGDFASENVTIDYILSYREAIGYFAGIIGGFVEFADDGTCGISQYGYDDNVLIDGELISYTETSSGEMEVGAVSCNRSRAAMVEDIIEAGQGGQEISFVNPHITQTMLNAIYTGYVGMRFAGAIVRAPWVPNLNAGEFVRIFTADEYRNYLMLRNNLDQNGGEMEPEEIEALQADMNSLGKIILISSQTINFVGDTITTITSVCGTETEKSNPPATRLDGRITAAGETASRYITYVDAEHGIRVYDGEPTNEDVNFAQLNADGMQVYKGGDSVAEFGSAARIGKTASTNYNVEVDNSSVKFNKGTDAIASIGLRQVGFSSVVTELKAESADGVLRLKAGDNTFIDLTEDTQTETSRITIYTDNNQIDMTKYGVGFHAYKYSGGESLFTFNCSDSGVTSSGVQIGIGAGGINHGLYSIDRSNYLIYGTNSPTKTFFGGNAGDRVCPGRNSTNGTNGLYLGDSSDRWNRYYGYTADDISSDRKIKDNIKGIDFAKDLIMGLEPVEYHLKDSDHRRKHMGFIAQDVAEVCKGIGENLSVYSANYIDESKGEYHGEDVDDSELSWGIAYTELIAPLVKVVQTQQKQIEELKEEMVKLKANLK